MAKRGPKTKTRRTAPRKPAKRSGWAVPAHLDDEATRAWTHVVALLERAGNLDRTDPTLVEAYAVCVSLLRAAQRAIAANGIAPENRFGFPTVNPACLIVNSATMRIKAIVADLGLCPATSKYAAETNASAKQDTKWDGLLGIIG